MCPLALSSYYNAEQSRATIHRAALQLLLLGSKKNVIEGLLNTMFGERGISHTGIMS